jgi:16S rRNA (guanine966-N2)-methyltransferase
MRIISGSAAGRHLKAPPGYAVRPTPDLVKQAVFNRLGGEVVGARVLELFAGTAALSLECLSRGASHAVCVEKSSRHAGYIRQNLALCGFHHAHLEVRIQDVFAAIHQLAQNRNCFDLILADPPFGEKNTGHRSLSLAQQLLDDPSLPTLLSADGCLILGHSKRDQLEITAPWAEQKRLHHGDSIMCFLGISPQLGQNCPQTESPSTP